MGAIEMGVHACARPQLQNLVIIVECPDAGKGRIEMSHD